MTAEVAQGFGVDLGGGIEAGVVSWDPVAAMRARPWEY